MKKIFIIMAVAIAVHGAQAQQSEELTALQKQLNELSAKIAQLEKANAEKTALVEQTTQIENANAAKIAQIEKDNAQKTWSLEQLQAEGKKNLAGAWANDIKLKGDIRARYESINVNNATSNDRQRLRLRVGAYGKVNDQVDFGLRLATDENASGLSGGKRDSTNVNMDDAATQKSAFLDLIYADMHPEYLGGAHVFVGKMPKPWTSIADSQLIWDSDLNPEGAAVTYEKQLLPVKLMANSGVYTMKDNGGDDIRLWHGQLAAEKKIGLTTWTVGASDYNFQNAGAINGVGSTNLTSFLGAKSKNTAGGQFNLVEGFTSCGFDAFKIPVLLYGQYVVNTAAADNQDTAYLGGVTLGKAKDKGSWELSYNYRDIQNNAVVAGLNDSDFSCGTSATGCRGSVLKGKYMIFKNTSADLTYFIVKTADGQDANRLQADLNFKF